MDAERLDSTGAAPTPIPGEGLEQHVPLLLAAARAMTLDEAEAEDLVQTTLEIAVRRIDRLRDPGALRAWLLTIQAREAFRLRRRLRRLVRLDAAIPEIAVEADRPDERLAVRAALARLSPRVRAAVVLHHMAGLSVAEVAGALGTSPNTVKSQLKSGLARLRELLADE